MFKKYKMEYMKDNGGISSVDFFVNSKKTRTGFMHRACVIGSLPRLDDMENDYGKYRVSEDILMGKRSCKVSYVGRTWECYSGQTCLAKLWDQLAKLEFVDMGRICKGNPFSEEKEPDHEDLLEPDNLFGIFSR